MADGEPKRLPFDALSRDPDLEKQRLEVGWLIANVWMVEGRRIRDAIPGPNEAMRESARYAVLGPGCCRAYGLLRAR